MQVERVPQACQGRKLKTVETAPVKNKGGRPKGAVNKITHDIQAWARENAHIAKQALLDLCASESEKVRLGAAKAILERAYGAPRQEIGLDGATLQVFAGIKIVIGSPDATNGGENAGSSVVDAAAKRLR